jgi:hypothetical protein
MGPSGPGFPSALPALRSLSADRKLPVLVVGAGTNGDVVDVGANWTNFTRTAAAAGGPVWEVTVLSCGHLQFLDKQVVCLGGGVAGEGGEGALVARAWAWGLARPGAGCAGSR